MMNKQKSKTPLKVNVIIFLLICSVVVDQLSSFYDLHWEIAELTYDDPIYLGASILWAAIVLWLSTHIVKRKKHIPSTLKILTIVVSLFFIFEFFENEIFSVSLASFQFLEMVLWLLAYILSVSSEGKEWFVE